MTRFLYGLFLFLCCLFNSYAQKVSLDPAISPALFKQGDPITITYDVTGTALASLTEAWIWVWIPNAQIDAKYNHNPADANAQAAKFTKNTTNGRVVFSITFKPQDFFGSDIIDQTSLGLLLKGKDWSNGQTTDFVTTFWDGSFQIKLVAPSQQPLFVNNGDNIAIEVQAPIAVNFQLYLGDAVTTTHETLTPVTVYEYALTVGQTVGVHTVRITATDGNKTSAVSFQYLMSEASPSMPRPNGIVAGINYNDQDPTSLTLCLHAPGKTSAYVQGDFSDWAVLPQYLMKRDGEFFWLTLQGLSAGVEYAYRYVVDENLFMADPFADKILDPEDRHIPKTTYPELKSFPEQAIKSEGYFNRVSVFQTGQTPFNWKVTNFQRKPASELVIYELLIRDFFEKDNRNYQNLMDTISYFKRLGINAIQLMPIMEFNGNEGWGYNPTFKFAPDKYYGTKNKLKEFIDLCHQNDIAVILDMVMNHHDIPSPLVMLEADLGSYKPLANNPWFNVNATHPFSVFSDFNHESQYTKNYLDTVNHYWLNEFNVDGFRYDLSKGFTQLNSGSDVGKWSAYDASRIALLKRMKDKIRTYSSDSYLILEHFADNAEEKELANSGFLLWGNNNHSASSVMKGNSAALSGLSYKSKGWENPHVVGYLESHDEERIMYRAIKEGNYSDQYSVRNLNTALERLKSLAAIFFSVPGPKMIWQFGELGYDISINQCVNGEVKDCRLDPKPVHWDYQGVSKRAEVFTRFSEMLTLRRYPVFHSPDFTLSESGLTKQVVLKGSPYTDAPSSAENMNVVTVANFGLEESSVLISFPHTGTWYDYFTGEKFEVKATPFSVTIAAGLSKLFTDVMLKASPVSGIEDDDQALSIYPNPVRDHLMIPDILSRSDDFAIFDLMGKEQSVIWNDDESLDISLLPSGVYLLRANEGGEVHTFKFIKE